ncbi:MAG: DUF4864 domain-containing protein [Burkholderiales bacterium]|nr:DUF4864 domain-containing protein [Burkholderiales bacterium]
MATSASRSRWWWLSCMFMLSTSVAAMADDAFGVADGEAVRSVVQAQLDAFAADDADRAFGYASPSIRAQFADASRFMDMVRQGYAALIDATDVRFLPAQVVDGAPMQLVELGSADGEAWVAVYRMQRQPDGQWRIDGCTLLRVRRQDAPGAEQAT